MMMMMMRMMMKDEGHDDDSNGSSLLLSPDHHETSPPFHLLLLFYDCDPLTTLPLLLPLFLFPETLMCLPIPSVLILICASFLLVNQLGVSPPSRSKENSVSKKHLCVAKKSFQRTCA